MSCKGTAIFIYVSAICLCSKYAICASTVPDKISTPDLEKNFASVVHRLLEQNTLNAFLLSANGNCRDDAAKILDAAKRLELWALKVADASATIPSGLLQGNVNQFGDFDECLSAESDSATPQSTVPIKYCLAAVDLQAIPFEPIGKLMRSLDMLRSNLSDPGHRVPHISEALIGLCIPKSCAPTDVESAVRSLSLPFSLDVRAESTLCYDEQSGQIDLPFWFASVIFGSLLLCVASSTIVDIYFPHLLTNAKIHSAFLAFSFRRNWRKLVSLEKSQGDIPSMHGIRAIHVLALLLSHKSMAMLYSPYANRTDMAKMTSASWGILGRAAILYTDTFIILSGSLTAQSIIRELNRSGHVQLVKRLLNRYMRLTPMFLAIILWCTLLLPKLSSGPLWNLVVEKHADLCKKYWWRNLFYIHNYYGFENMCLTHTHQLGIDMQLFIVAPALVGLVWRYPKFGLATLITLSGASTYLRYIVAYNNELSTLVYFGESVSQMFKTATLSYILPTHRLTVYIFGVVLGWGLSMLPRDYVLPMPASILGWTFFGTLGINALLGSYESALPEYVYDVSKAANYAAFAPVMWGAFLTWALFACVHDAGGIINKIFAWRWFIVVTRLAYSVYLTQFPVFFYNVGVRRHSTLFGVFELLNLPEFLFIVFVSGLLTLLVELPFQEISDIFLKIEHQPLKAKSTTVFATENKSKKVP